MPNFHSVVLPHVSDKVVGTAFHSVDAPQQFPPSKDGKGGPFQVTESAVPPQGDFGQMVNFYVNLIGSKLERLNALQFDMTEDNEDTQVNLMANELSTLADALNVGSEQFIDNPKQLQWPLAGSYVLFQDKPKTGFDRFKLDLFFECEPTHRLVVNCTILIDANTGRGEPQSSSSSYVATSSHG
jgi:hypothetical protein